MFVKESATMPRSFLIKKNNYSHCPLKKRPVPIYKEAEDEGKGDSATDECSEPENLSTKPQDLSLNTHKAGTPPLLVKKEPLPDHRVSSPASLTVPHTLPPYLHSPSLVIKSSGGPLEPLNLNTQAESPSNHLYAASPHYPPPYLNFNYPYPPPAAEMYAHHYAPASLYPVCPARTHPQHPHEQLSPYAPRDSPSSPPHSASLPHRHYAAYPPLEHCGLSPTSTASSSSAFHSLSPPPATPEDLSSPGSVSSGSSSGSAGLKKRSREGCPAPRYQCPDCSKSYSTYSGLSKHQQFHCAAAEGSQASKKSFSCKYCEKTYVSLGALKMHIRTHTLPCKCKLCGKAFSRPWLLQGHIRTHTGEKPFTCPHCHRAFADRSNLRAHLQTHSDIKKYSCTSCSKTFSRMSLLSKHVDGGCPGAHPSPPPTHHFMHTMTNEHVAIY
uniref:C2H2-type domain-containing protein n=3 Tax=Timema TaxID=61471 RepID=A0A7R9JX64_TIMGE|nr:unnamed protein product [Timema genevievae]